MILAGNKIKCKEPKIAGDHARFDARHGLPAIRLNFSLGTWGSHGLQTNTGIKRLENAIMPGPSPSAHQVFVYSGPGVSPLSLSHTLLTLSLLLLPHYTVQPITPQTVATQPWEPSCVLLVIPGGRDLPYVEELTLKTKATRRIREFVQEGGSYLGICAGAYFGSSEVRFDTGGDMEVVGKRELVSPLLSDAPMSEKPIS